MEEMRIHDLDEGVQGALEYLFDYEFSDDLSDEEVVETSMSLDEQSLEEVPAIVFESVHLEELSLGG